MLLWQYSFGHLTWEGRSYRQDLIILPGEVICPWRREHGHRLSGEDLVEIIQTRPAVVVIGTGAYGVMAVPDEVLAELSRHGIDGRPMSTGKAIEHFAALLAQRKMAAAALHLTC